VVELEVATVVVGATVVAGVVVVGLVVVGAGVVVAGNVVAGSVVAGRVVATAVVGGAVVVAVLAVVLGVVVVDVDEEVVLPPSVVLVVPLDPLPKASVRMSATTTMTAQMAKVTSSPTTGNRRPGGTGGPGA
jgi:hypothetical protein